MPRRLALVANIALGAAFGAASCSESPAASNAVDASSPDSSADTGGRPPAEAGVTDAPADAGPDATPPPAPPTLGDYWVTNAFGQPKAKWQFQHALTHSANGTDYLATSFNHIVIGPPGRCPMGVLPWWDFHGGGTTTDAACGNHAGWGTQVSLSCDEGTTWSPEVQAIAPAAGGPWACYATDGRVFYDAPAKLWHFLFQCMGEDGQWNGCHLENPGDPDKPMWKLGQGQTSNPVILGGTNGAGSLWGSICQPGDKCGSEAWVGEEGTFDIFQKDAQGYFWIDFHGLGASGNLYRGIARTQDFVHYDVNGAGGTPTDSVYDPQTQSAPGNDDVNEVWPGFSAGGAGTIVQDGNADMFYLLVENIDDNRDLDDPNTDPGADKKWDISLGRQTSLGANDWDFASLPEGNPIFLSAYDQYANSYPKWMGGSDCYPYLFFDPHAGTWHLMACREQGGSIDGSVPVLYELVRSGNALPDGDFNTRPGKSGNGNWKTLAVSGGTVNLSVYRLPFNASDDQQYLETNTSTAGGSVYQDVPGVKALAGLPVHFGGKVKAAAPSNGTIAVFEFDANGTVIDSAKQAFSVAGTSWTSVDYSGAATWSAAVASVRFQMYVDTVGVNVDFDEMYLDAP